MRVVFVKADVPPAHKWHLTSGKEYVGYCEDETLRVCIPLLDDTGETIYILLKKCAFLNGGDWTLIRSFEA